eukprot:Opistho-2@8942
MPSQTAPRTHKVAGLFPKHVITKKDLVCRGDTFGCQFAESEDDTGDGVVLEQTVLGEIHNVQHEVIAQSSRNELIPVTLNKRVAHSGHLTVADHAIVQDVLVPHLHDLFFTLVDVGKFVHHLIALNRQPCVVVFIVAVVLQITKSLGQKSARAIERPSTQELFGGHGHHHIRLQLLSLHATPFSPLIGQRSVGRRKLLRVTCADVEQGGVGSCHCILAQELKGIVVHFDDAKNTAPAVGCNWLVLRLHGPGCRCRKPPTLRVIEVPNSANRDCNVASLFIRPGIVKDESRVRQCQMTQQSVHVTAIHRTPRTSLIPLCLCSLQRVGAVHKVEKNARIRRSTQLSSGRHRPAVVADKVREAWVVHALRRKGIEATALSTPQPVDVHLQRNGARKTTRQLIGIQRNHVALHQTTQPKRHIAIRVNISQCDSAAVHVLALPIHVTPALFREISLPLCHAARRGRCPIAFTGVNPLPPSAAPQQPPIARPVCDVARGRCIATAKIKIIP